MMRRYLVLLAAGAVFVAFGNLVGDPGDRTQSPKTSACPTPPAGMTVTGSPTAWVEPVTVGGC